MQPFYWIFVAGLIGAGTVTAVVTRGISLEAASQVWSAFGTIAAVLLALGLALKDHLSSSHNERKRAAAAAILLGENAYRMRALLSTIAAHADRVKSNKLGYGNWLSSVSSQFRRLPPIIEDKYLPFVGDLPDQDLFLVAVFDQWLRQLQRSSLFPEPTTLDVVINGFDSLIDELVTGYQLCINATDRLHALSLVPGSLPWASPAPSWALPPSPY